MYKKNKVFFLILGVSVRKCIHLFKSEDTMNFFQKIHLQIFFERRLLRWAAYVDKIQQNNEPIGTIACLLFAAHREPISHRTYYLGGTGRACHFRSEPLPEE